MTSNPLDLGFLRLFDTVARHGNLTRAAGELRLTQPALSYRIRQIEDLLGITCFVRRHRGMELTPEGAVLHEAVRAALERIDDAVVRLRRRNREPAVRLATDYAFAAFWLMPRVAAFRAAHPGIEIHIVASQTSHPGLAEDAEIAVLFGRGGDFPDGTTLLMPERVAPVCSPGLLTRTGPLDDPKRLAEAPLLHLEGDEAGRWYSWGSWLGELGVGRGSGRVDLGFNTYTLVIQAALAEQGVALGWLGLVDDLLASGALVQASPITLESRRGYWLLPPRPGDAAAEQVAAWIRGEVGGVSSQ